MRGRGEWIEYGRWSGPGVRGIIPPPPPIQTQTQTHKKQTHNTHTWMCSPRPSPLHTRIHTWKRSPRPSPTMLSNQREQTSERK